jgi:hypothetical protein
MNSFLTNTMNIINNPPPQKCYEKCLYSFNYPTSNHCTVTNIDKQYLNLDYNYSNTNSPVSFNNVEYTVSNIRIYFPSLHNFNDNPAAGEIIIYHGATNGTKLNVCVPLNVNAGMPCPLLNNILNEIISHQIIDNQPHDLSLDQDYNINSFVKYAPYYYYLDDRTNYIVYGLNDGILITNDVLNSIKSIITKPYQQLPYISELNYNEKGPYNNIGDEIYIDCQPVDSEGNLLIDKSNKDYYKKFNIGGGKSSSVSIVIISVFLAILLLFIVIFSFKSFGSSSQNGNTSLTQQFLNIVIGSNSKSGNKSTNGSDNKVNLSTSNTKFVRNFMKKLNDVEKIIDGKLTLPIN